MCSFIPFCCCMKNIDAKKYAIIGIVCNGIKLLLSGFGIIFIFSLGVFAFGGFLNIFEIIFTIVNLTLLIILLIKISNGKVFNDFNKTGKVLCMVALILSGIIIALRLLITILGIILYAREARKYNNAVKGLEKWGFEKISVGDWILFLVPTLIVTALEIIHFLAVNYLYRLIKIPTNLSYNDYITKGQSVEQVSVTVANAQINQNPPMFPYNNPNQIPSTNQQNDGTESNKNIN